MLDPDPNPVQESDLEPQCFPIPVPPSKMSRFLRFRFRFQLRNTAISMEKKLNKEVKKTGSNLSELESNLNNFLIMAQNTFHKLIS
jgi:hypothetical protein